MDRTAFFRRTLIRRFFQVALLAVPAGTLAAAGCTSSGSGSGGGGDVGQNFSATTGCQYAVSDACYPWAYVDGGASEGSDGSDGSDGSEGSDGGGEALMCPSPDDVQYFNKAGIAQAWVPDDGGPYNPISGLCCYKIAIAYNCCMGQCGRPFLVEDHARTAPLRRGGTDAWEDRGAARPRTEDLTPELRAILAEAWTRDGLFEHASIASFGRFALELLAVGAPADLIAEAHRAALDEVRHARLCLGLASAYAGATIAPARFPFQGGVEVEADLASVAARAAREGCIGETLAAIQAAEQLAHAEDPAVRAALAVIVEDEARHAELAWHTVAWALREGGLEVRAAVEAAFAEVGEPGGGGDGLSDARLLAHGRLSEAEAQAAMGRGLCEVVLPFAAALLRGSEGGVMVC